MRERDAGEPTPVQAFWEITKPDDPKRAIFYRAALDATLATPKELRFREPFDRKKKSGGTRTIVPAAEPLRTTQYFLSDWIRTNLSQGRDYCYTGREVKNALEVHKDSNNALVCDLENAFDQVTENKIKYWFRFYEPRLNGKPLEIMTDLLTYKGRAPQGCRSTAFAFNVCVAQMDQHLKVIGEAFGAPNITRYSDNICFSAKKEFDAEALEEQVRKIAGGFGFKFSWTNKYSNEPIDYLGAKIDKGKIFIPDEKVGQLEDRIYEWIDSGDPQAHYYQALGILTWARGLSGPNVNPELLHTLDKYFKEIGKSSTVERLMGWAYGRLL